MSSESQSTLLIDLEKKILTTYQYGAGTMRLLKRKNVTFADFDLDQDVRGLELRSASVFVIRIGSC